MSPTPPPQATRVSCTLADCAYWHRPTPAAGIPADACDCTHPEKKDYLKVHPCPLYKRNWAQATGMGGLKDRFRKGPR